MVFKRDVFSFVASTIVIYVGLQFTTALFTSTILWSIFIVLYHNERVSSIQIGFINIIFTVRPAYGIVMKCVYENCRKMYFVGQYTKGS